MAENNSEFVGGSAEKQKAFGDDLRALINRYSLENDSNTPDIVLACYLLSCLKAFNQSVNSRANLTNAQTAAVLNTGVAEWRKSEEPFI